jgi:hypothetical protein
MSGTGHPLPGSDEARHDQIPEHLIHEKGRGDDSAPAARPDGDAVNPDGEAYPAGPPGPDAAAGEPGGGKAIYPDRRRDVAETEAGDG